MSKNSQFTKRLSTMWSWFKYNRVSRSTSPTPPPRIPTPPTPHIPTPPPAYYRFQNRQTIALVSRISTMTDRYLTLYERETDIPIYLSYNDVQVLFESLDKLCKYLKHFKPEFENTIYNDLIAINDERRISLKYGCYNKTKMATIQQDHWDPVHNVWLLAKKNKSDMCAINFVRFHNNDYLSFYSFLHDCNYKHKIIQAKR